MKINYAGKTALITGASSGLGVEFADQLASRGADLVLVARREDRLQKLASQIISMYGVSVTCLPHDLAHGDSAALLLELLESKNLAIDVLVNNAGFATNAQVVNESQDRVQEEIQLNIATLTALTIGLSPAMKSRKFGVIINVASTAAFQPVPNMAVYAASKAFVLSFTEALWGELKGGGVKALALCPGATVSEFWDVAGLPSISMKGFELPASVVANALRELDKTKSKPSIVSGRRNRIMSRAVSFVPKRMVISVAAKMFETKVPSH